MAAVPSRHQYVSVNSAHDRNFIQHVIEAETDHFNLHNLQAHDQYLIVKPAPDSEKVYDLHQAHIGYHEYTFETWCSPPVSMEIDVSEQCKVWVCQQGQWITLVQWLQQKSDSDASVWTTSDEDVSIRQFIGYDKQWRLWKENGKKFELLRLPAEIRSAFYELFLGPRQGPSSCRYARVGNNKRWNTDLIDIQQPESSILRLNRQVYLEASYELFEHTIFRISRNADLYKLLNNQVLASRIQRVELALSHSEFLELFHTVIRKHNRGTIAAEIFKRMKLKELHLEIEPPHTSTSVTVVGNTWNYHDRQSCQNSAVDIILQAALPWLIGTAVTVKGYVKTKQKHEFEVKCAAKRQEYLEWCKTMPMGYDEWTLADFEEWNYEVDGGVKLDGSDVVIVEVPAIEPAETVVVGIVEWTKGDLFPPECHCEMSCALDTWIAEV